MVGETGSRWEDVLARWREARGKRIGMKKKLLAEGMEKRLVRGEKEYRRLAKEQRALSTIMRHLNAKRCAGTRAERPGDDNE